LILLIGRGWEQASRGACSGPRAVNPPGHPFSEIFIGSGGPELEMDPKYSELARAAHPLIEKSFLAD
jgi:hypothetical protein